MDEELFAKAKEAMARAYAPYSKFAVGAAVRGATGVIFGGCNVENAVYPLGCCAEASAISAMVMAGEHRIVEVCVIGAGEGLVTPCGGCRQKIREFASDDTPIHVCGPEGLRRTVSLGDLLPLAFGPENLSGTKD